MFTVLQKVSVINPGRISQFKFIHYWPDERYYTSDKNVEKINVN